MINKKLILLLVIGFLFFTCQKRDNEQDFVMPSEKEINEIIHAVIIQDSLDKLIPVQWELHNLTFFKNSDPTKPPPPPGFGLIEIKDLLNTSINGELFFSPVDTFYLKTQSLIQLDFKIDTQSVDRNFTTEAIQQDKFNITKSVNYYRFTKPLFSKDKQKAYIQMDHICRRLCGAGLEYYLVRRNNKWIIADKRQRWIS